MPPLSLQSTVILPISGLALPRLGFGVYQSTAAYDSVSAALNAGYRHIDSARVYRNEEQVGRAVRDWINAGGPRDEKDLVFLTSKITGKEHPTAKSRIAIEESVERLRKNGLQWDLFLLHDPTQPRHRLDAYRVLEQMKREGHIRSIGVSNFSDIHLEEFRAAGVPLPDVNQIELHPFCQQRRIVEYCKKAGIVIQAYSPVVRATQFDHPTIQSISKRVNKSPAQILIRWSLQKGYVPLPKSDTPERIIENSNVYDFQLSDEMMAELDDLDQADKGAVTWNPVNHI